MIRPFLLLKFTIANSASPSPASPDSPDMPARVRSMSRPSSFSTRSVCASLASISSNDGVIFLGLGFALKQEWEKSARASSARGEAAAHLHRREEGVCWRQGGSMSVRIARKGLGLALPGRPLILRLALVLVV